MANKTTKILALITLLEGILAAIVYFLMPDLAKPAWILGLTKERIASGALYLLPLFFWAAGMLILSRKPALLQRIETKFLAFVSHEQWQDIFFLVSGWLVSLGITYSLLVLIKPLHQPGILIVMGPRLFPLVVWGILFILQTVFFYIKAAAPRKIGHRLAATYAFLWLIFIATNWHWATLIFRLHWHEIFSLWLWDFNFGKVDLIRTIPAFLLTAAAIITFWLLQKKKPGAKILLLLFVVGYFGQFLLLNFGGDIFKTAQATYLDRPIMGILDSTCNAHQSAAAILSDYRGWFKDDGWLITKAPGYILFYTSFRDAVSNISPVTSKDCVATMASAVSVAFPFFAVLVLIPMYGIWSKFRNQEPFLPGLIYIFTPNIIYFMMIADQAVYPLIITAFLWLMLFLARERPWWMSLITGAILYLLVLFSFSLLPLLGAIIVWAGLNLFANHDRARVRYWLMFIAMIAIGFAIFYLIFLTVLHYNPVDRFLNAFQHHRINKDFTFDLGQFSSTIFLNNFEFALFVGIPIFLLFIKRGLSAVVAFLRKDRSLETLFSITLFAVFIALNLLSQTRGEVGRLWILMVPAVVLMAIQELRYLPLRRSMQYPLFLLLQVITTLLFLNAYVIY
jgi:hypothetical protein